MPTTGIVGGTAVTVYVGGVAVAHTTNHSWSESMETRNTTTKDSGIYSTHIPTRHSGEVTIEGLVAYDAVTNWEELRDSLIAQSNVTLLFGTHVTGDPSLSVGAYVTGLNQDAPLDDNLTFSATFVMSGTITEGIFA